MAAPEEGTERALGYLKSDTSALVRHGGRDAAIDAGYTLTPSAPSSGLIPWQTLHTTEQTQAWMDHLIRDQADYINARCGGDAKGVMSDADMASMLTDRTKAWNEDPAEVLGMPKAAGDGEPRCYLRTSGRLKVRLRSMPGTPEFMLEYQEAISGTAITAPALARRHPARYLQALVRPILQERRVQRPRCQHEELAEEGTGADLRDSRQQSRVAHAAQPRSQAELLATLGAANGRLKALRALFNWANEAEETTVNPTFGVKSIKYASDGHHIGTDAEIARASPGRYQGPPRVRPLAL